MPPFCARRANHLTFGCKFDFLPPNLISNYSVDGARILRTAISPIFSLLGTCEDFTHPLASCFSLAYAIVERSPANYPCLSPRPNSLHCKVEQHRENRAVFFSRLDAQTEGDVRAVKKFGTSDPAQLAVTVLDYDAKQLLALLAEGKASPAFSLCFITSSTNSDHCVLVALLSQQSYFS